MSDNPFALSNIQRDSEGAARVNDNPFSLANIERDQQAELRGKIKSAVTVNPDQAAEADKLAKRYPVPQDVLARNLLDVKMQAAVEDADAALQTSPKLARALREKPWLAQQSHDDFPALTTVAKAVAQRADRTALGTAGDIGVTALKGAVGLPQAFVGLADLVSGGYAGKGLETVGLRFEDAQKILDRLYSPAQQQSNEAVKEAEGFIGTLGAMLSNPSTIATTVGESAPQMLGGAAIGKTLIAAAPKLAPWLAAALGEGILGAGSAAEQIRQQTDDGLLSAKQVFAPIASGAGIALFGAVGGRAAQRFGLGDIDTALVARGVDQASAKTLKQGFIAGIAKAGISEGVFEELPQSVQEQLWQNWALDRPLGQGVGAAAAQGLLAGLAMGGGFQAVTDGAARVEAIMAKREQQTAAAEATSENLKTAMQAAASSKLRERNPETFNQLVQFLAESNEGEAPTSVFIDAQVLAQSGVNVAELLPSVADQMEGALASNGTVEVAISDVLTAAPGTPLEQVFLQNARGTPDGLSVNEAKQAADQAEQFVKTEADRVMTEAADQQAWAASAETVKTTILDQLNTAGRFTSDVNEAYATLVRDFYAVTASRQGITPEQMYARYPLRVGAQAQTAGPQLEQAAVAEWADRETAPAGSWVKADFAVNGVNPVYQVRDMALNDLYLPELDEKGRLQPEKRKYVEGYAERVRAGETPPSINVIEMENGKLRVVDGHRRVMAARAAGQTSIRALVSPLVDTPNGKQEATTENINPPGGSTVGTAPIGASFNQSPAAFDGPETGSTPIGDATTVEVDGKTRPALNSKGQPIHPTLEGVRNFWRWFGDSKVVDADGKPLVVYHGTNADFQEFTNIGGTVMTVFGSEKVQRQGFFFTPDEKAASTFGTNVMPVYLAFKSPFDVRDGVSEQMAANMEAQGVSESYLVNGDFWEKFDGEDGPYFVEKLRAAGYDGVRFNEPSTDQHAGADALIAFDPTQIKSATGNSGAFSGQDANILRQDYGTDELTGLPLNPDGTVTVYHHTSAANAQAIQRTGQLKAAAEPDVYVTTRKETDTGYGDTAVAIRVNPELLRIDDEFPDGRVDYRIATGKPGGSVKVKVGEYPILNQQARGTFSPSRLAITLNENADLSTFLHESGHFFLEVMADLASQPNAPADVQADMASLLKWFGVADTATWQGMTLDQKRPYHERFAESFEQYLLEGKAPNTELQPLFRKFRSWMLNVYKSLTQFMRGRDLQLSDDVRQVFDRMLATDEQIKQAEEAAGLLPNFDATNEAIEKLQARSLRDLKWAVNARNRAIKKLQKEAAALRKDVEAEVRAEVEAMPVYAAQEAIARIKGEASAEQLETIAETVGYTSASQMLAEIATAGSKASAIEGMTDQRMLERHGDLVDQRAIEEAANEAVHNEARARSLATELKAQSDALNPRRQTGVDVNGRPVTVNALVEAAKQFAQNLTARRKVKDLKSSARQHRAAEARAGKRWQEATAAGKTEEAIAAKRDQLLNNYTTKALLEVDAEVRKIVDYLAKFDKDTIRKKLPAEYLDQIDALRENMDLRTSVTGRELERRASLRKWVESQQAMGLDPIVPDELLDAVNRVSYKEMTVEELRAMRDVVKNIEHLGRLKSKLLAAKDKREFDAVAEAWSQEIRTNGGKPKPVKLEGDSRIVKFFKGAWADHRKLNSLIRQFAGGADNSEGFKALIRSMNERGTQEDVMVEKAAMDLAEIHKPIEKLPGGFSGAKLFIPEINNSLTRAGRLSVALNWGNEQNRQRLRDGDNWSDAQVEAILRTLTPTELTFVNDVWEYLDSYWPEVKAKQERVSGVVEEKVEAEPFVATAADGTLVPMRGGYYPIKYDGDRSLKSQKQEAEQIAKDMLRGAVLRPSTRRGHTKARVDEVVGRPVKKDLSVITQHVTQVVHDLAWHEWAIDANRLMNDPRIASAIRDHYGAETHRAMTDAVEAIVVGDVAKQSSIDQLLLKMRANVTRSIMGASLTTALLQPFGLTQSMARIGVVPVLKGAGRWAGDAARMESTVNWVREKSNFMRLRSKTFNRELREISQRVQGKSKFMQVADASLFMLMQKLQMVADIPTWVGAYEKALNSGLDEATAVQLADEAVLSSQGGGNTRDLSAVQRDLPFLTQFYSYFNTTLNLVAEKTATTDFRNPRAAAGWVGDMLLLVTIPAILPALITFALKGGGEDDDPEKWAKRLAEWQAGYMLGMFVGLRELPALWSPFDYGGPPAAKLINDGRRLVQQANQGEVDDQAVLATIGFLGTALGLPTTQVIRSYKGWLAWDEGNAPPSSILFGPPPKD